jgi:CarD family transcriptional regulator
MFQIGNKVYYPVHGGGIIEAIEEKEVLGEIQLYYVINILHRNIQVMVPIDKTARVGLRLIVDPDKLDNVLTTFYDGESDTTIMGNQRHRVNMHKIKSGDIYEGAEVIRDLMRINNKKKLGMTEKNMLDNARQILISEVELVKGILQEQAAELIDRVITVP